MRQVANIDAVRSRVSMVLQTVAHVLGGNKTF
jgi:hypothetical protein